MDFMKNLKMTKDGAESEVSEFAQEVSERVDEALSAGAIKEEETAKSAEELKGEVTARVDKTMSETRSKQSGADGGTQEKVQEAISEAMDHLGIEGEDNEGDTCGGGGGHKGKHGGGGHKGKRGGGGHKGKHGEGGHNHGEGGHKHGEGGHNHGECGHKHGEGGHKHGEGGHKHGEGGHKHGEGGHKHGEGGHKHGEGGHKHGEGGHKHGEGGHKHGEGGHKHGEGGHKHGEGGHKHGEGGHKGKHGEGGHKHGEGGGGGGHKGKHGGGKKGRKFAQSIPDDEFDNEVEESIKADIRMFSGCEDAQTSADVQDVAKFGLPDASGAGGACTNAVLANVKDHRPDTWMGLLKGMRGTLKEKKFKQVPQLATSRKLDIKSPFTLSGEGGGNYKALLIGINYTGQKPGELKGCHNDVVQMREYIVEHGFPAEAGPNLRVLVDDNTHTDPTKDNILAGIRWLVRGAKEGDSLFMHFSGHGGSVLDSSGDEEDGKDETMVPVDYKTAGQIKDDVIFEELVMPLPAGVTLSVVMDCCHSGSILDLPYAFDATEEELELVESGNKTTVPKKKKFNVTKLRKAKGKKH